MKVYRAIEPKALDLEDLAETDTILIVTLNELQALDALSFHGALTPRGIGAVLPRA